MSSITSTSAPVKRYVTDEGRILNALDRARDLGHYARKVNDNHYRVYSAQNDGTEYDVFVTSSGLRCSCKSGQFGKVCKHLAKVGLRLNREGDSRLY
jgi:hypothetical protein